MVVPDEAPARGRDAPRRDELVAAMSGLILVRRR